MIQQEGTEVGVFTVRNGLKNIAGRKAGYIRRAK